MLEGAEDLKASSKIENQRQRGNLDRCQRERPAGCCEQRLSLRVSTPAVYAEHWEAPGGGCKQGVLTLLLASHSGGAKRGLEQNSERMIPEEQVGDKLDKAGCHGCAKQRKA